MPVRCARVRVSTRRVSKLMFVSVAVAVSALCMLLMRAWVCAVSCTQFTLPFNSINSISILFIESNLCQTSTFAIIKQILIWLIIHEGSKQWDACTHHKYLAICSITRKHLLDFSSSVTKPALFEQRREKNLVIVKRLDCVYKVWDDWGTKSERQRCVHNTLHSFIRIQTHTRTHKMKMFCLRCIE